MKFVYLEEKLTPAAKKAVEEIIEDYKNELMHNAMVWASFPSGECTEISLNDVIKGKIQLSERPPIETTFPRSKFQSMVIFSAIFYFLLGFAILIYGTFGLNFSQLNSFQQIGFVLVFVGFVFALMPPFNSPLKKYFEMSIPRKNMKMNYFPPEPSWIFIKKWIEFELRARESVALACGEASADKSFSGLLTSLLEVKKITPEDEKIIKELLNLRNEILHKNKEINVEELETLSEKIQKIYNKL